MAAVAAAFELDLGDAGKLAADHVAVVRQGRAESVQVDLLEEVTILRRALSALRIPRVVEARAIGIPRDAPARRAAIHTGDHIPERLSARHFVDVNISALAAALGERNRHVLAVQRRHIEIDGRRTFSVQLVWIHNHAFGAGSIRRCQGD